MNTSEFDDIRPYYDAERFLEIQGFAGGHRSVE
jgi:hypothetical protein